MDIKEKEICPDYISKLELIKNNNSINDSKQGKRKLYFAVKNSIITCTNNPNNSSLIKTSEHNSCVDSMPTIWGFDNIEDKHTLYRGKICMKKFCTSLIEMRQI